MVTTCSNKGIFYSLELEEKILEKNNLNNNARFFNLVDTNPGSATGFYIGHAGPTIYYRSKANTYSNWSKLSLPSGFDDDATNTSMTLVDRDGGTTFDLYISRISRGGSNVISGVYRMLNVTTSISGTWDMIVKETKSHSSYFVYKLHTTGVNNLYINQLTKNSDGDTTISILSHSSDPNDLTPTINDISTNLGITSEEVLKVASYDDTINVYYWLIFNNSSSGEIYGDINDPTFNVPSDYSSTATVKVKDLFIYSETQVLISNYSGSIYSTINTGSTWASIGSISGVYNGFADIGQGGTPLAADTVIVGTMAITESADGYHLIDMSVGSGSVNNDTDSINFSDTGNYNSADLSNSSINGFLMDTTNSRLFAYTWNAGVWLNIADGVRKWTLE